MGHYFSVDYFSADWWKSVWMKLTFVNHPVVHTLHWESAKSAQIMRPIRAFHLSCAVYVRGLSHFLNRSLGSVNTCWKRSMHASSSSIKLRLVGSDWIIQTENTEFTWLNKGFFFFLNVCDDIYMPNFELNYYIILSK